MVVFACSNPNIIGLLSYSIIGACGKPLVEPLTAGTKLYMGSINGWNFPSMYKKCCYGCAVYSGRSVAHYSLWEACGTEGCLGTVASSFSKTCNFWFSIGGFRRMLRWTMFVLCCKG